MRRLWRPALSGATAYFTLPSYRPSAPASMRRPSPASSRPLRPLRIPAHRQRRLPIRQPQPQTDRMTKHAAEAADSTLRARTPVARVDQVSKLFGAFAALRQVSVEMEAGRCYVLIGENGAGKSTLLRI